MSEDDEPVDTCCASCGIAEIDDMKLMDCDDCDLVRYCSDECRENHKSEHEEDCKKRAAELRDELLFKQPEGTHLGDCPICCLPIPLDQNKSTLYMCCSTLVCNGCVCANIDREREMMLQHKCPFCRKNMPRTKQDLVKRNLKRVEMNDPNAMWYKGEEDYSMGNYRSAFGYFTKAAALGNARAHNKLSNMYILGNGVEMDEEKVTYHLEEAAIGGHPDARCKLGLIEWQMKNTGRAVKHFIIAAALGEVDSIKELMKAFRSEAISKEELNAALRAHQDALNAMKSPQRKIAEGIVSKYS